ncbi:MAG TPA: hypothetical protein VJ183_05225 [Chloroflexia bacterium]|nr:hypothetical protein [Chloroflexia bacterium]
MTEVLSSNSQVTLQQQTTTRMFVPEAPVDRMLLLAGGESQEAAQDAPEGLEGYLQITLGVDGRFEARGSRLLLDWLLRRLAADGWIVQFDEARWCG